MWLDAGDGAEFKSILDFVQSCALSDAGPRYGRLVWETGSFTGLPGEAPDDTAGVLGDGEADDRTGAFGGDGEGDLCSNLVGH